MDLGKAIKEIRQKALYTQEDFAKELNVALSTVNRWELNKAVPNIKAMRNLKIFCQKHCLDYSTVEANWIKK